MLAQTSAVLLSTVDAAQGRPGTTSWSRGAGGGLMVKSSSTIPRRFDWRPCRQKIWEGLVPDTNTLASMRRDRMYALAASAGFWVCVKLSKHDRRAL